MIVKGKKLVLEKVKTVNKKYELSDEDDYDFKSCTRSSEKPKILDKVKKKEKKVVVIKESPSTKNRCSPGSLLHAIQGLSREQKECIRAMGFGSSLRMKMIDVPLKIIFMFLNILILKV